MSNIINATTTESAEDITAAGKHYGIEFDVTHVKQGIPTEAERQAAIAAETQDSSKPGEGEKPAEVEQADADPDAKPTDLDPAAEQADREKHKKLLKQIDRLTGKYKTEEGNRKALEDKVAALEREIAAIGKKEPDAVKTAEAEPEAPKRPERPKRPRLEQFEYDSEAFDVATEQYENEVLPDYEDKLSDWTRAETVREIQKVQAQEAEKQALAQESEAWNAVLDARDGLREKLEAATDIKVSGAMDSVLRTMMTPEERATILDYLVDNPDVAEELTTATTSLRAKPNRDDWEYNTTKAAQLLTRLELRINPKGPVAVPDKPKTAITPPAKPKPVSAAPPPIEPVGTRAGAAAVRLDDPELPFEDYLAQREQQRMLRRKQRG